MNYGQSISSSHNQPGVPAKITVSRSTLTRNIVLSKSYLADENNSLPYQIHGMAGNQSTYHTSRGKTVAVAAIFFFRYQLPPITKKNHCVLNITYLYRQLKLLYFRYSVAMAAYTKAFTGLTGLAVSKNPVHTLGVLYR